jgi:glycosyltransferase involved in cell wall biosynthesis
LFEELSKKFDLHVYFCKRKYGGRLWPVSLHSYSFKNEILKSFNRGSFIINYSLPFKLLRDRYDVYLVGENPENLFATFITFFVAKMFRKPFIIWSGVIETEYSKQIRAGNKVNVILLKNYVRFINTYRCFLYRHANAFIAYSNKAKDFLVKKGVQEERIFVGGQVMPESLLQKVSISKSDTDFKDKKIVLYLGYLNKRKGVDYLIKAFKNLQIINSVLIIAGAGDEEDNLKSLARDDKSIYFSGYVEGVEKSKYYSIADIFVLPTLHDPWGLVINEAMYFGLPIIITDAADASEIIKDNGFVIKPGDQKALENALKALLEDDELRKKMGMKSKEIIKDCNVSTGIKPFVSAIKYATGDHP